MAPIFASPDIAALVTAFPPPVPTKERPSLVKSNSGGNLLDSRKVLVRFRVLLETSASRIKKVDLPAKLGVERAEWVLDCYEGQVSYSRDWQTLLPELVSRDLVKDVKEKARSDFVDAASFASQHNIARQSLHQLLDSASELRRFREDEDGGFIGGEALIGRIEDQIVSAVQGAGTDKSDLSASCPNVPHPVLLELAEDAMKQHGISGEIVEEEGARLVYVPYHYYELQERTKKESYQVKVAEACQDLVDHGFSEVRDSFDASDGAQSMGLDVQASFRRQHEDELILFKQDFEEFEPAVSVVAKLSLTREVMTELESNISELLKAERGKGRPRVSLDDFESAICKRSSHLSLVKHLLRSNEHRRALERSLSAALKIKEDDDASRFASICQKALIGPLELHAQGLRSIADQALSERLDPYVCEHVRTEIMPTFSRTADEAGLIHDKARAKDLEKLTSNCTQAKTVAELQSAATKFCRKQKIAAPEAGQLSTIKQDLLKKKMESVMNMIRGSDVLQNLIWILLAQTNDGVFISAGKDTSRMIKYYQSVGDADTGGKLEAWRDALKAGKQSDEDVRQMKAMATKAVESICGGEDAPSG